MELSAAAEIRRLIVQGKYALAEDIATQLLLARDKGEQRYEILELRVQVYKALDKYNLALIDLEAIKGNNAVWVAEEIVDCLVQMGDYEAAMGKLDMLIDENPKHFKAINKRGKIRLEVFEDFNRAIEDFDRAIAVSNEYSSAHFNKGKALEELGDLTQAKDCYVRAIQCANGNPKSLRLEVLGEVHYRLAKLCFLMENLQDTVEVCDACLVRFQELRRGLVSKVPKIEGFDPRKFFLLFQEMYILKSTSLLAMRKHDLVQGTIVDALALFEPIKALNVKHQGFENALKDCKIRLLLNQIELSLRSTQTVKTNLENSLKTCTEISNLIDSITDHDRITSMKTYKLKNLLFKAYLYFKSQQRSKALDMINAGLAIDPSNEEFLTAKEDLCSESLDFTLAEPEPTPNLPESKEPTPEQVNPSPTIKPEPASAPKQDDTLHSLCKSIALQISTNPKFNSLNSSQLSQILSMALKSQSPQ
jgi:tetratricopeptide (TPR) repeat protein